MLRKASLAALVGVCASAAVVTAAAARPDAQQTASAACTGTVTIGMLAPITGPAASIGGDQLHWAQFYVDRWNKGHKLKINLVQGDTQLDPAKASTVAQSFASNNDIVGVIGPAGSDEVIATAPILKRAGLAFISGSATRVSLSNGKFRGYFFRVVPNDNVQGPSDVDFMLKHLGVKKGSSVMVVDDQEAYSTGLADIVQKTLTKKGVDVDRESISQKSTDFSALVAKVGSDTKVVFTPFQLAAQAQLIAQQLKAQGKQAVVFGSDGTFDSSKFKEPGNYISFFAPDVTTIKKDATLVKAFHKAHPGATSPFGAPNYVAAQAYATAATQLCKAGKKITRASMRAQLRKANLKNTILGGTIKFTRNGDVAGAKFFIFKIQKNGKYVTVA
ncbi:MAG TPA: branched-chain amino acid ABC transporter substrate-binding protein [Gaiellaceae bacterium]|jgi:branched-chain amino acid transport system substrate-binding protein|nr:branched-chain amino acid ABC transporter substrate-binding protein [Gaiellaceae bacterium]